MGRQGRGHEGGGKGLCVRETRGQATYPEKDVEVVVGVDGAGQEDEHEQRQCEADPLQQHGVPAPLVLQEQHAQVDALRGQRAEKREGGGRRDEA